MITQEELKRILGYRKDGKLVWKVNRNSYAGKVKIGAVAGTFDKSNGYTKIIIDQKKYYAHRLIYFYHYGEMPNTTDHINRDRLDNRIENLRSVTSSENSWNKPKAEGNFSSKYKGVSWCKVMNKFRARIKTKGKEIRLGYFEKEDAASLAYNNYIKKNFKEHGYLNQIGK